MSYRDIVDISVLLGKTLTKVSNDSESVTFETADGEKFLMQHQQDCCETVELIDGGNELEGLIGSPLLVAEESSNSTDEPNSDYADSYTWTYYRLATVKHFVVLRWYGVSNGYYSESVSFYKM